MATALSSGVEPWLWSNSGEIIARWVTTGKRVQYGQCWVFAAVTTTLSRALGIPCRPVTNFNSAHEKPEATATFLELASKTTEHVEMEMDAYIRNEREAAMEQASLLASTAEEAREKDKELVGGFHGVSASGFSGYIDLFYTRSGTNLNAEESMSPDRVSAAVDVSYCVLS